MITIEQIKKVLDINLDIEIINSNDKEFSFIVKTVGWSPRTAIHAKNKIYSIQIKDFLKIQKDQQLKEYRL